MNPEKRDASPFDLSNPQTLLAWQRNHMANERTMLAWSRTGLSLIVFSFVIERFDFFIKEIQNMSQFASLKQRALHTQMISFGTFCVGVFVLGLGFVRYMYLRKVINTGRSEFSSAFDIVFAAALMLIVASLGGVYFFLTFR